MSKVQTRPTPADVEASIRAIIGAALYDPVVIDKYAGRLPIEVFTDLAILEFWSLLADLRQGGMPVSDIKTVAYEAKRRLFNETNVFAAMGGAPGLARLSHEACLSDSVPIHVSVLNEFAKWLRLDRIGRELSRRAQSGSDSANDVQQWLQEQVQWPSDVDDDGPVLLAQTIRQLATVTPDEVVKTPIPSGFPSLDALTGGWLPGNYICLAARPSVGKSALGFQICCNAAHRGARVLYVSIEMTDQELGAREIASNTGINVNDVLSQRLEDEQRKAILGLADRYDIPLYTWAPSSATVHKIEAHARCLQASVGCDFIGIDYLSLLDCPMKTGKDWERIALISRQVKQMAKRLKIPVLVLSQLNRESEKGTHKDGKMKRPSLADLAYSGAVEMDADQVLLLHRETRRTTEAELILAKGRNTELCILELDYDGRAFTFSEPMGKPFE